MKKPTIPRPHPFELGQAPTKICKAVVEALVNGHARNISNAARYLIQQANGPFSNYTPNSICVTFSSHATFEQKNIVAIHTRTLQSDIAAFTNMMAEQNLIQRVTDARHIWCAAELAGKKPSTQSYNTAFKLCSDPLEPLAKFPPHLTSHKNLTTATSALRLLKARAEYRHPHEQPARILENAMPDYLLRDLVGKWLTEWKNRSTTHATPQPFPPTPQTAAPDR